VRCRRGGIEAVDAVEEAAAAHRHAARGVGVGIEPGVDVPAIGRHLADGVAALDQQLPVGRRIVGATGESAPQADDGDRLARGQGLELLVLFEREQGQSAGRQPPDAI
jgi:hypothetical protein